jgi:hypothetical protein
MLKPLLLNFSPRIQQPLLETWFFLLENSVKKSNQFEHASKRPLCHFGQVDFDMSIVIGVVF